MTPIEDRFPRPSVMGVLNVTPDSFSDGGVHLDPEVAAAAARRMVADGAAIVDVGGESTRPGSDGVSVEEELARVVPVLERLGGEIPALDRHDEGSGRARGARAGRDPRQRRHRAARRPRARGRRRGRGRVSLSHAHAGRAAHDAGGAALHGRRLGGRCLPRRAARVRGRGGDSGGADLSRSRASASARPSSTTSSSCGGSTC